MDILADTDFCVQMYGMPFFVTVSDANGIGWTNGPLHPTGAGSTKCLDLDSALGKQS